MYSFSNSALRSRYSCSTLLLLLLYSYSYSTHTINSRNSGPVNRASVTVYRVEYSVGYPGIYRVYSTLLYRLSVTNHCAYTSIFLFAILYPAEVE